MSPLPLPAYDGTDATLQFILDRIATAFIDTGGQSLKLRSGTSSVTYTAAATSAQKTIPHGMGSTPVRVWAFQRAPLVEFTHLYESTAADATNIYLTGRQIGGAVVTNTQNIYWFALG